MRRKFLLLASCEVWRVGQFTRNSPWMPWVFYTIYDRKSLKSPKYVSMFSVVGLRIVFMVMVDLRILMFHSCKQVFYRERLNGYYGVAVFILSNFISSFPFLFAISVITGSITYSLVKFRPGFSYYAYFCANIYLCISVIESCMMVVASLVPNFLMGIITGAGIIVRNPT